MTVTRREFLSTSLGVGALGAFASAQAAPRDGARADVVLRIGEISHEVAPGHVYRTTAYNGAVPGPLVRLREGVPVDVEIINDTDQLEYLHWHGLHVSEALDGTAEEGSLSIPARGSLRYRLTPAPSGFRFIHSHAMSMPSMSGMPGMHHGGTHSAASLTRGPYSGQFACVYVDPRGDAGAYDREIFLATHEWGAELIWEDDDDDDLAIAGSGAGRPVEMPVDLQPPPGREIQYDIGSINGRALGHGEPIRVRPGERVLVHLLNASATASVDLALAGHDFRIIALDGNAVPAPRTVGIVIEYANRVGPPQWRAPSSEAWDYTTFGRRESESEPSEPIERVPLVIDRIAPGRDGMESWTINGERFDPERPTILSTGRRYRLALENRTSDEHPMHLHRYSFELTRLNGRPTAGVIKDVVTVSALGIVEIDVTFDRRGLALLHCHQQMHMDTGFKTLLKIV